VPCVVTVPSNADVHVIQQTVYAILLVTCSNTITSPATETRQQGDWVANNRKPTDNHGCGNYTNTGVDDSEHYVIITTS